MLYLAALSSCSGGESATTQPPVTPVPTSIQLSVTSVSLRMAESRQLTATIVDQQNRPMSGQAMTWSSSDTMKVTVDAAGLVRGVRSGTASVTVSSGLLTASASGTVLAPQVQLASGTVEKTIGPEGGSISTTDAGGKRYTLTLNAGWSVESTKVTIAPLAAIENLPLGSKLLAGAHFTPEGLELNVPGTLTIEGVSAVGVGSIAGFGYTGTGADLYRASAGVAGGTISLLVSHFSGTGASNVQDASTYPTAPLTGASWTYMQTVINLAQQGQQTGTYDVPAIVAAINDWSTQIVEPALVAAGSDALLVTALGRLRQWRYIVFCGTANPCPYGTPLSLWPATVSGDVLLGTSASFQRSKTEAKTSLEAARNRAHEGCVINQDLQAAKNGLYWLKQGELFFPGELPSVESALANLCVKVVIEDASFPQNPAPNVPATLRVGGGLRFGTNPVSHTYPVDIEVNASGVAPGQRFATLSENSSSIDLSFTPDGVDDVFFGIRVKEPWSGWDVHQDTIVHRPLNVSVTVTPTAAILNGGGQATFSAIVTGVQNTAVTWSATGGAITAGGVYTAGQTAGVYQVKATSVGNPLKSGTAQVTIIAPNPVLQSWTFDSNLDGWTGGSEGPGENWGTAVWVSRSGNGRAKLDGTGSPGTPNSWIFKSVALPATAQTLRFDVSGHDQAGADALLKVRIVTATGTSSVLLNQVITGVAGALVFSTRTVNIAAFAGQTVTFYFEQDDNGFQGEFPGAHEQIWLDNIQILRAQ
jgi:hypothetical protein